MRPPGPRALDRLITGVPLGWLVGFLALPMLCVAVLSLRELAPTIPPVANLVTHSDGHWQLHLTPRAFGLVLADPLYRSAFLNAIGNATCTAVGCLLVGFPIALAIVRSPQKRRGLYVFLAILPFWTSFLLRAYAWMGLLRDSGPVNSMLLSLGLIHRPIAVLYTPVAVLIVMIYSYLPFFVLPMYAVLEKLPKELFAAAADLGGRPWYIFRTVTLPLSLPGILSGAVLVFVPAVGEYVIPELVGNSDTIMIGGILWDEFYRNRDWPVASAIAILTFATLLIPIAMMGRRINPLGAELR
jgi:putrescine transport system permease protein